MIWIYEQLTDDERAMVSKMEPFLGFSYEPQHGVYLQTDNLGKEYKNGSDGGMTKAKLFGAKYLREGFVCDDIEEAHLLSQLVRKLPFSGKNLQRLKNLDQILEYLRTADAVPVEWIAIPFRAYCEYYGKRKPKYLENAFDDGSLKRWRINLSDYIKH